MVTVQRCVVMLCAMLIVAGVVPSAAGQYVVRPKWTGDEWLTQWWSWPFWWEANREHYMVRPATTRQPPAGRDEAVAALLGAVRDSPHGQVKAAAALALGRLEEPSAVSDLIRLTTDGSASIRRSAWMALGLIGDDAARQAILDVLDNPSLSEHDTIAWIVAVGLLQDPGEPLLRAVYRLVNQNQSAEVGRMAMWALRVHNPPGLDALAREIIDETPDAVLTSEAILALGITPTEDDLWDMIRIYHLDRDWEPGRALVRDHNRFLRGRPILLRRHERDDWRLYGVRTAPTVVFAGQPFKSERAWRIVRRALMRPYETRDTGPHVRNWYTGTEWNHLGSNVPGEPDLRFGLIALGRVENVNFTDDNGGVELLIEVLRGQHTPRASTPTRTLRVNVSGNDPARGFAAVALGLALRPTPPGPLKPLIPKEGDDVRHSRRRSIRALTRIANNAREPADLRAACLLGLGLSQDVRAADAIMEVIETRTQEHPLVSAYAVLGLGLLGDARAINLAGQLLPSPVDAIDLTGGVPTFDERFNVVEALTLRAITLGLGVLGDERGRGMLKALFGRETYTSMELIRSLRWTGDDTIGQTLVELLDLARDDADVAMFTAWSLGELHDPNDHPRLDAALLKDVNLTLPVLEGPPQRWAGRHTVYRYRCYTNEFLFKVMFPMASGGPRE